MRQHDEMPLPLSAAAVQLWALDEIKDSRPPKARWVRRAGWREAAALPAAPPGTKVTGQVGR